MIYPGPAEQYSKWGGAKIHLVFWSIAGGGGRGSCGVVHFKNGLPGADSIFFNTVMTHQSCFNSFKNKKGISNKESVTMHSSTIIFACFIYLLSTCQFSPCGCLGPFFSHCWTEPRFSTYCSCRKGPLIFLLWWLQDLPAEACRSG